MGLAIAAVQAVQKSIEHIAVVVIPFEFLLISLLQRRLGAGDIGVNALCAAAIGLRIIYYSTSPQCPCAPGCRRKASRPLRLVLFFGHRPGVGGGLSFLRVSPSRSIAAVLRHRSFSSSLIARVRLYYQFKGTAW